MSEDNVHHLKLATIGESVVLDANAVLSAAMDKLSGAVVVGRDKEGGLYFASTHGNAETLFFMEKAKMVLLNPPEE